MKDHWTHRLSEYLDDELSGYDRAELEAHLEGCFECRRILGELRLLLERTREQRLDLPSRDLWPGIAGRLDSSPQADPAFEVIELRARQPGRLARRFAFTLPQLAAAGIALMLLSGGMVWFAVSNASVPVAGVARNGAVQQVSTLTGGAAEYAAAVESLEEALQRQRNELDPVTVAIVEENLRTIDAAITEARAALEQDPGNQYLNQHLENTMKRKIQLLRRATALRGARS